ncbi:MAG: hypothetical protein KDD77_02500 [Caldilineaceae bacterium]|nr:hypothetical protein [Caldilineaceae bacterium]
MNAPRIRAERLALVNWRGVFYAELAMDRHVTALEGDNGAGKTTALIATYVVLLPDLGRLRFTNLGEGEATGGDRGIWGRLGDPGRPAYAWYVRVPDLPRLVRHLRPVLEKRLAASPLRGYSGELKLSFYRDGLRLAFAAGQLTEVAAWPPPDTDHHEWQGAGFPPLVFLQLLFGYRSLAELRATFPDVYAEQEAALLLDILFPKSPSTVYSMSFT